MSKKIDNILHLEFSYTVGYAIESNTIYKIDCDNEKCMASIKHTGSSKVITKEIDKYTVATIKDMLNENKVQSWDNYSKSNKHVLDGNSFHMYITTNFGKISASGYESWPKNYDKVKKKLDLIFNEIENDNNSISNNTNCGDDVDYKPIIYLYPEKETDVSIKLGYKDKLTATYPSYNDGWEVTAYPDGTLVEKNTNRKLYSLFWEGLNTETKGIRNDGFVIKGIDSAKFLEEKLDILGLNYKEKEEFIIYWLPKLINNKYNYIRFESKEEQDKNMPLIIYPKPATIIRINMEFMPLDKKIAVKEQKLESIQRKGYTLIEWGGTVLNEKETK